MTTGLLYDAITRIFGVDKTRRTLLDQANVGRGQRILDVGCGTGTFAVLVKRLHPDVEVVGVDPDPNALARSARKAARAGIAVSFDRGSAQELPYAAASFDRVFSSFMFHHLPPDQKPGALREMHRVLKPDGSLHLVDFGGPESSAHGLRARFVRAHGHTRDNFGEGILTLIKEAGFASVTHMEHGMVLAGPVAYYRAVKGS